MSVSDFTCALHYDGPQQAGEGQRVDPATHADAMESEPLDLAHAQARIVALRAEVTSLRADRAAVAEAQDAVRQVRNTLAIIRSVFARTAETAETLEEMSMHFTGRFDALVRSGGRLWGSHPAELEDLVRDELLNVGESDGRRTSIEGPPYLLSRRQAPLVGLALHELATNAIKFGALAGKNGRLSVTWQLDDTDGALHLSWSETGVPIVATAPLRIGFGRQFIEQALPYQLDARTSFELRPGGLVCQITILASRPDDNRPIGSTLP